MKEARILTEDEKRFVREAMGSPFWGIFQQFVEAKIESWDEESENTLSDDIPSILKREQLLGAMRTGCDAVAREAGIMRGFDISRRVADHAGTFS